MKLDSYFNFIGINSENLSNEEQISLIISKTLLISSVVVTTVSSILVRSSSNSIWSLLNQYQLFLMLPLLNTYLPSGFVTYMYELRFVLLDFSFASFFKIPWLRAQVGKLDYEQPDKLLESYGIKSGAHIINQLNNTLVLFIFISLNLLLLFYYAISL